MIQAVNIYHGKPFNSYQQPLKQIANVGEGLPNHYSESSSTFIQVHNFTLVAPDAI